MRQNLKLIRKEVYGRFLYYPNCDITKKLCKLIGAKTLTREWKIMLEEMRLDLEVEDPKFDEDAKKATRR